MNPDSLTPDELAMVDRWIEVAHGSPWNDPAEEEEFKERIKALNETCDIWSSSWEGFGSSIEIGSGTDVFLDRCIESATDSGGSPSDDDFDAEAAIEGFRRALGCGADTGVAFAARELLGSTKTAYLVEMVGDRGELESFWLSPTAVDAEEEVRSFGVIFPEGSVPSGKTDTFSDEDILALIKQYELDND